MKRIFSFLCVLLFCFIINVKADSNYGIIIDYYDDEGKIAGADFRVFKIAEIVNDYENDEYNALKTISLLDGLTIDNSTKIDDILAYFDYEVLSESRIIIENDELISFQATTDKEGKAYFDGLDRGIYLVIEQKASDDHLLSLPAIISLPYTFNDLSYDHKVIEPKSILAGDISITKKLYGNNVDENKSWHIKIDLPLGKYAYSISNGQKGYIESGDILAIKANEVISIDNVLANYEYTIEEIEANTDGYRTFYENKQATIKAKSLNNSVIYNERYHIPNTKDDSNDFNSYWLIMILIVIMLVYKKVKQ